MGRYVAFLRGINVGGKNLIKMAELKRCFEGKGFEDVSTYIQSGNVLFTATGAAATLTRSIEAAISKTFDTKASVVLRSDKQLRAIVDGAPKGFGKLPKKFRYDVLFLKPPLTAKAALDVIPLKEGVDTAHSGPSVVYHSRLIAKATSSKLSRVVAMPVYKSMTIRNWNTTTKLLKLLDAD